MQASFVTIGPGAAGILDTLHRMRAIVRAQQAVPIVRLPAVALTKGTGFDGAAQIRKLRLFLHDHTEFVRDPTGVELLQTPDYLLTQIRRGDIVAGDCDDLAMLAAALGMSIGLRARFVALGRGRLEHVFTELADPRTMHWTDLDLTRPRRGIPPAMWATSLVVEL